jgi:pimeloyl-ACP methyl ester carboxylesterase
MPDLRSADAVLHVESDGEGEPVTVFAHGITGSCLQLAPVTPVLPGTKVRFCFRGHGHSKGPDDPAAYGFPSLAGDLRAVADAYGATRAAGVSLGAGALCALLAETPDRFERLIFLLPAVLDEARPGGKYLDMADRLDGMSREQVARMVASDPQWRALNDAVPGVTAEDVALGIDPQGLAMAIRGVVGTAPFPDRDVLRRVTAPSLVIGLEGDTIHPASVAREMAELLPNAELIVFGDVAEIAAKVIETAVRAAAFLA